MERATGIEPVTSSLGSWHSTAELRPLSERWRRIFFIWNRTVVVNDDPNTFQTFKQFKPRSAGLIASPETDHVAILTASSFGLLFSSIGRSPVGAHLRVRLRNRADTQVGPYNSILITTNAMEISSSQRTIWRTVLLIRDRVRSYDRVLESFAIRMTPSQSICSLPEAGQGIGGKVAAHGRTWRDRDTNR